MARQLRHRGNQCHADRTISGHADPRTSHRHVLDNLYLPTLCRRASSPARESRARLAASISLRLAARRAPARNTFPGAKNGTSSATRADLPMGSRCSMAREAMLCFRMVSLSARSSEPPESRSESDARVLGDERDSGCGSVRSYRTSGVALWPRWRLSR